MSNPVGSPRIALTAPKNEGEGSKMEEEQLDKEQGRRQPGGGRNGPAPQSCNLEQLYHEALPLDKALSHR